MFIQTKTFGILVQTRKKTSSLKFFNSEINLTLKNLKLQVQINTHLYLFSTIQRKKCPIYVFFHQLTKMRKTSHYSYYVLNPNAYYSLYFLSSYEKRTEFERDVRARNVSALHRKDPEEDHWTANQRKSEDRKRTSRDTIEKPIEKAAKKEEVVKSWREKREAERATEQNSEPEPGRLSWREKLAEKQKQEEEEKKQKEADAADAAASAAEAKRRALAAAADTTADSSTKSAEPTGIFGL